MGRVSTAITHEGAVAVRDRADVRRQVKLVVVFALVVVALLYFAQAMNDSTVTVLLGERKTADDPGYDFNGRLTILIGAVFAIAMLALAAVNRFPKRTLGLVLMLLVGVAFFAGFIIWAYADKPGFVIANPLPSTVKLATPLILGALAGCLCERSGVINIAIEGQMLMGAFFAAVFASLAEHIASQNGWDSSGGTSGWSGLFVSIVGLVGGVIAGLLIAAMLAAFAMRYVVDQIVLGVVLIAFATGLTGYLLNAIPDDPGTKQMLNVPPVMAPLPLAGIPGISDLAAQLAKIPVLGPTVFNQTILVYLMYAAVVYVTWLLFKTRWGLRVRSVGEHPMAADTVGIKVNRMRWQAVLLGGVFAGLGGAFFTVGSTGAFDKDASAGNGFIALAAVIMGRWHPVYATCAALFFGFMSTLQIQLGNLGKFPTDLVGVFPYVATIIAVAGFVGRVRAPAADGQVYVKS